MTYRHRAFLLVPALGLALLFGWQAFGNAGPGQRSAAPPVTSPQKSGPAETPAARRTATPCQPVAEGQTTNQQGNAEMVRLNQLGYLPGLSKVALVDAPAAETFQLVDAKSGRVVCQGPLGEAILDEESLDELRPADFSNVEQPGRYTLVVPGVARSLEFTIGSEVYADLFKSAINSYDALAKLAPPGFQETRAQLREGQGTRDVGGGWPDAGDYGRYMPTAAASVGQLLVTWDALGPKLAEVPLDVANETALPDFLAVLKVELDWMLKMQREDGGVYHKVTPEQFGPMRGDDGGLGGQQYVWDVSTADTALFAAATAKASRAFQTHDRQYAEQLLAAAERAWQFLEAHPEAVLPPPTGGTGAYVYAGDEPQRFWAAAELFRATGQAAYDRQVRTYWERRDTEKELGVISWLHPHSLGMFTYYHADGGDDHVKQDIKTRVLRWANGMVNWVDSPINLYKITLSTYAWASNKQALDNAMTLLQADRIEPDVRFREAALDQLHYILGRNAVHKSFVTGFGGNPVKHPHNRSLLGGKLVPGVLVGGPNSAAQDGHVTPGLGPRSYADKVEAYSVNENSIEYNAPLVYVAAAFALGK